jgi:hypothetical protein
VLSTTDLQRVRDRISGSKEGSIEPSPSVSSSSLESAKAVRLEQGEAWDTPL